MDNILDYSEFPEPFAMLAAIELAEEDLNPQKKITLPGLEFSPQNKPMAPQAGAAPAAPVEPRPKPAPVAKATGGYSSITQSQSSSQDSRADSLFGG